MNKYIKTILAICIVAFTVTGCTDFLSTSPRDKLSTDAIFNDPAAIKANIANLYDRMQTEDLGHTQFNEGGFPATVTDEAVRSYTWGSINDPLIPSGGFQWWGYGSIREVNIFLEGIVNSPVTTDQDKNFYTGEARFIRAFYYFSLVKRYGGVPIIKTVQKYTGNNIAELKVPRNTEKEVYDFINSELKDIIETKQLPQQWDNNNKNRATIYAAMALRSRAMLYAASIATYAYIDLDGAVGIPVTDKEYYWNEAYQASNELIQTGKFSLYNNDADKEKNFQKLFLESDINNHSEAIFMKTYLAPSKAHSFDFYNAPQSFKADYGCVTNPTLELVEEYEYTDGTDGKLKTADANGDPIVYENPYDLFKNKDPRLLASVLLPFSSWHNGHLEIRKGIINNGEIITAADLTSEYGPENNKISIIGKDGIIDTNDPTKTGFYIKKFMNPTERLNSNRSETPWIVFRYAETLLNYAEAAFELGKTNDALTAINQIRDRAGIIELSSITMDQIRKERKLELAFENHRWWDLRRWRTADKILDNYEFKAIHPYLIWEEGKHSSEMKYIFKIERAAKNTRTFLSKLYYVNIPGDQILSNSNLVQNPLY